MPQLIAIGLVGGLVWYAVRALKKQMKTVGDEVKKHETTSKQSQILQKGEDGVYRPVDSNK